MIDSEKEKYLLNNSASLRIYNRFARDLPIIDYHCHLKPDEIYKNRKYNNITELLLEKDHYKWRLMRANGIEEDRITGNASDKEKFFAWAETIERCPGNPLYQWASMELSTFFGITKRLNKKNASDIWFQTLDLLGENGLGAKDLLLKSKVRVIGTTDDPMSELIYHKKIATQTNNPFKVIPTFRLDKLLLVEKRELFTEIQTKYSELCKTLADYLCFIRKRIQYFLDNGGRSGDLGLSHLDWRPITTDPDRTFAKLRSDDSVDLEELNDLKQYILIEIMAMFYEVDWVCQLHIGALGSINNEARGRLGAGTGFDTIVDQGDIANSLIYLFNELNNRKKLPKTILYNIDSTKNSIVNTVLACFQDNEEGIRGKLQHGPAWWFQDTLRGNRRQLEDLAEQGILMNFIGMTTDSRSFLSYVRHDYFRRILCDCLGEWVENGDVPNDESFLKEFIEDVCFKNAQRYFGF